MAKQIEYVTVRLQSNFSKNKKNYSFVRKLFFFSDYKRPSGRHKRTGHLFYRWFTARFHSFKRPDKPNNMLITFYIFKPKKSKRDFKRTDFFSKKEYWFFKKTWKSWTLRRRFFFYYRLQKRSAYNLWKFKNSLSFFFWKTCFKLPKISSTRRLFNGRLQKTLSINKNTCCNFWQKSV